MCPEHPMDVTNTRPRSTSHSQPEWWSTCVNLSNAFLLSLSKLARASRTNVAWLLWGIFVMVWAPRIPNPAPSLDTLPPELVERILAELGCQDILIVRRCCRRLSTISKARAVWENAIQQYLTTHPWLPKPEEPLHAYSNSELERWLVNRTQAQHGWNSAAPPRLRQMDRKTEQAAFSDIFLIPGGRWLLKGPVEGVVTAYDLDTPEMKSKSLILPMDELDIHRPSRMAISLDNTSHILKFDIVLASRSFAGPLGRETEPRIRIWRVVLSGHGQDAELVAEHLTSFAIPSRNLPTFISFDGEYIAQVKHWTIEILKWTESTSSTHATAVIFPEETPEWVCFFPGARMLTISGSDMIIYDIPPFDHVSAASEPAFTAFTLPSWKIPCRGHGLDMGGISPMYMGDDSIRFTVSTRDGVRAIVIPTSPDELPQVLGLGLPIRNHQRFLLGVHNSVIHDRSSVLVFTHKWAEARNLGIKGMPTDNTAPRIFPTSMHQLATTMRPCLDEASARLVLVTRIGSAHMLLIVDFADTF